MGQKLVFRDIFPAVSAHLKEEEITVIIGPRQVGKTTLVTQLKDHLTAAGVASSAVYYFNLDVLTDRAIFNTQSDFIQFIKNRLSGQNKLYIFIDEAQRIENAGIFFKGVYDLHLPIKLILTGSSSLEIRAKTSESLTGRKRLFRLYPLSFGEYIYFVDKSLVSFLNKQDAFASAKLAVYLHEFIVSGAYPKVILEKDHEKKAAYLEEIFTSYVEKDVVNFLRIKNAVSFTQFVQIVSYELGGLFNSERVSKELAIKRETVKRYLDILEETFIVRRVFPFFRSPATEIRKMPKIYFLDSGIRNFAKDGRDFFSQNAEKREERGSLLENFIFNELVKLDVPNIRFWRTKDDAEVDFIIEKKGMIIPIEVKSSRAVSSISRGFRSFMSRYAPKTAVIITMGEQKTMTINTTDIYYMLPYQLFPFISNL